MTYQQVYKTHYSRIVRESVLKSAIFGLFAGLAVAAVVAFVTIFVEFNGLWTALGSGLGVAAITAPVLYFALFRPNEKSVAARLDRLGFDERVITMLELEGDTSVMAELQRRDAVAKVTAAAEGNGGKVPVGARSVMKKLESVGLGTPMLIAAGVVAVFAITSLVLTALPTQRVKEIFIGTPTYTVTYNAGGHGYLVSEADGYAYNDEVARTGKITQTITEGKYGKTIGVSAYDDADAPYMFVGWSDGYYDEYNAAARTDKGVMGFIASAEYTALDVVADDPEEGIGSGNGEDPGAGNGNAPMMEGEGEDSKGNGSSNGMEPPGNGAGSSDTAQNGEVYDGNTDYHEDYSKYYDEAMKRLSEGQEIPDSLRKMINAYFTALK